MSLKLRQGLEDFIGLLAAVIESIKECWSLETPEHLASSSHLKIRNEEPPRRYKKIRKHIIIPTFNHVKGSISEHVSRAANTSGRPVYGGGR